MNNLDLIKRLTAGFISVVLTILVCLSYFMTTAPMKAEATTDSYTSSGSWNAPTGVTSVTIEAWGGGGGGPSGTASNGKGGGGGGAYASKVVSVTPSNNYTVTVGSGGPAGSSGGDTWFSTSGTVLAKGGSVGTATTGGGGGSSGSSIGTTTHSGGGGGNQSGNGKGGGGGGGSATSSSNGGSGGVSNGGGSGGSGEGSGGSGGSNNSSGSSGSTPGGGGGGGGANGASGAGAGGRVTITYTAVVISVNISDGTVDYGILGTSTSKDTSSGDLDDTQIATNDGSASEDFNIKGQDSADWTLSGSAGSEAYKHAFCTAGSGSPDSCDNSPTWNTLTTSYQSLSSNIPSSNNQRFDIQISTPSSTNATNQQDVDITVQAVAH